MNTVRIYDDLGMHIHSFQSNDPHGDYTTIRVPENGSYMVEPIDDLREQVEAEFAAYQQDYEDALDRDLRGEWSDRPEI